MSDRQRETIESALTLGYYEIPREAGHEDVARELDCVPSTAAEHLRKAEATLLRSMLGGTEGANGGPNQDVIGTRGRTR